MRLLISGGAGYIGRAIMLFIPEHDYVIYSRDEQKQDVCRRRFPTARYILGDVRDTEALTSAMRGCDLVIHAAALKYVPEAEYNVGECISVNVNGSQSVLRAAARAGVKTVVGISTDKAVKPLNVYGYTKALMERLFAEASSPDGPKCVTVRYGNVIGSTGSVIPLFQRQFKEDGEITVTNPRMTRFWLPAKDAVDLIFHAAQKALYHGSTLIPRARAMELGALAEAIAGHGKVKIIGARPGEKEHEELLHYQESGRVQNNENYWELINPPNEPPPGLREPFTIVSHSPGEFITKEQMRRLIKEAEAV